MTLRREPAMRHGTRLRGHTPPGWRTLPFSDAVLVNPTVSLPKGEDAPFVDMASLEPGRSTVSAPRLREYRGSGSRFVDGDTLMARITPSLENGKIARFRGDSEAERAHGSTEFIVVRGREGISDTKYAFYLTRSDLVREYAISQMTGTSGRQRVPPESLGYLEVVLPPLAEQRAIAHILGTLDDKIELNRRMNEALEAMARALFKSWFVDFDPVRTKMAGRDTGLPRHIADLFPDRLLHSELGRIPSGWEVRPLRDCVRLTMGQSPPGRTYNDHGDGLPFFQGRREFGFRYPRHRRFCSDPRRIANLGDTLVSVRAPVGDINMAPGRCCIGRGLAAVRHRSGSGSYTYHLVWALQPRLRAYEHTGTVFGAINKGQFESESIVEPPSSVVDAFRSVVTPFDARIASNTSESSTLAVLRDVLLPKLMSGVIPVDKARMRHG